MVLSISSETKTTSNVASHPGDNSHHQTFAPPIDNRHHESRVVSLPTRQRHLQMPQTPKTASIETNTDFIVLQSTPPWPLIGALLARALYWSFPKTMDASLTIWADTITSSSSSLSGTPVLESPVCCCDLRMTHTPRATSRRLELTSYVGFYKVIRDRS